MTPREQLLASLKAVLPSDWQFINSEREVDNLETVAVWVRQRTIRRAAAAPIGAHQVDFLVIVAEPRTDWDAAEAALDDSVADVLHTLDGDEWVAWTEARKILHNDKFPAYEIDVFALSGKD